MQAPFRDQQDKSIQQKSDETTRTLAVLGLVLGVMSWIVMAVFFGPAAIVLGSIAGSRGSVLGWIGAGLGAVGLVVGVVIIFRMESLA